jgi:hypothetical protein
MTTFDLTPLIQAELNTPNLTSTVIQSKLVSVFDKVIRAKRDCKYIMDVSDQKILQQLFDHTLIFIPSKRSGHAILKFLHHYYLDNISASISAESKVLCLGTKLSEMVTLQRKNPHIEFFGIFGYQDAKDDVREIQDFLKSKKLLLVEKDPKIRALVIEFQEFIKGRKTTEHFVTAANFYEMKEKFDVAIALNSLYDMKLLRVWRYFYHFSLKKLIGTIIFCPELITCDHAPNEILDVIWERHGCSVAMKYAKDCNNGYFHKRATFMKWNRYSFWRCPEFNLALEVVENKGGYCNIELYRTHSATFDNVRFSNKSAMDMIRIVKLKPYLEYNKKIYRYVAKEKYWAIYMYCMRLTIDTFEPTRIFAQASGIRNKIIIGGAEIQKNWDVDMETWIDCVHFAIFHSALDRGMTYDLLSKSVRVSRNGAQKHWPWVYWFTELWDKITLKKTFSYHEDIRRIFDTGKDYIYDHHWDILSLTKGSNMLFADPLEPEMPVPPEPKPPKITPVKPTPPAPEAKVALLEDWLLDDTSGDSIAGTEFECGSEFSLHSINVEPLDENPMPAPTAPPVSDSDSASTVSSNSDYTFKSTHLDIPDVDSEMKPSAPPAEEPVVEVPLSPKEKLSKQEKELLDHFSWTASSDYKNLEMNKAYHQVCSDQIARLKSKKPGACINKGSLKFKEILEHAEIKCEPSKHFKPKALFNCEYPGGMFSYLANFKRGAFDERLCSLRPSAPGAFKPSPETALLWKTGQDLSYNIPSFCGDMTDIKDVKALIAHMDHIKFNGIQLHVADGSLDHESWSVGQERKHAKLLAGEMLVAISTAAVGSFACFKFFTSGLKMTRSLIFQMSSLYTKVELFKPPSSNKFSPEIYLLCYGFLRSTLEAEQFLESILTQGNCFVQEQERFSAWWQSHLNMICKEFQLAKASISDQDNNSINHTIPQSMAETSLAALQSSYFMSSDLDNPYKELHDKIKSRLEKVVVPPRFKHIKMKLFNMCAGAGKTVSILDTFNPEKDMYIVPQKYGLDKFREDYEKKHGKRPKNFPAKTWESALVDNLATRVRIFLDECFTVPFAYIVALMCLAPDAEFYLYGDENQCQYLDQYGYLGPNNALKFYKDYLPKAVYNWKTFRFGEPVCKILNQFQYPVYPDPKAPKTRITMSTLEKRIQNAELNICFSLETLKFLGEQGIQAMTARSAQGQSVSRVNLFLSNNYADGSLSEVRDLQIVSLSRAKDHLNLVEMNPNVWKSKGWIPDNIKLISEQYMGQVIAPENFC